jgi:hypothetical protein
MAADAALEFELTGQFSIACLSVILHSDLGRQQVPSRYVPN